MTHYKPEEHLYQRIDLDLNMKIYNELLAEIDSQTKNPPQKRLSKKQFYKLLERNPTPLITTTFDDVVILNHTELLWFPQCKKPFPIKEVMELKKKYFPNLFKRPSILDNLPAQGTTSTTYYFRRKN